MKLSIGTPPVEIVAIADTGSDLTWTQCMPCENCFQQSSPLFDSKKSSTYKTVGCNVEVCTSLEGSSCVKGNVCEYQMSYGDQSHTIGDLAFDKFTFPSTSGENVVIPNVAFGCGHDNGGTFNNYTSGIIGLGGGKVSMINQLDKEINGKFSYCLIPIPFDSSINSTITSHINFGSSAIVSGPNVVSTPLIKKEPSTYYYLNLEGVSVGNKMLKFKSSKTSPSDNASGGDGQAGNIIIDSGTTLTLLPNDFYSNLESTLVNSIHANRKDDPSGTFHLCYESQNGTIDAPTIITHFTNADLELSPSSTFAEIEQVSDSKSVNGFTLDLIHRDSPLSPYHDPSNTPFERLQKAFHRSFSRASFFGGKSVHSIQSTLTPNEGEFLMKISIGTPPIDTFVIADTGSDLTWTQLIYGDLSHTRGDLSSETFRFASSSGKNVSIPNIVFGCGHDNGGSFTNVTSGIIGLGGGNVSIVNQMHHEIKGKFSYCLIPLELLLDSSNATSHINFGDNAIVSGPSIISTPIFKNESPTFYYLNLKGISIGNKTLEFKSSSISQPGYDLGNIVIDSGTTLTYVPDGFYLNLELLLMRSINATRKDDPFKRLDLCYESNENSTIDVPKIVAHFTNADLELSTSNIFTQVVEGIVCLTIVPGGSNQISILGNLAQANFLIGYDLKANKVSFKPTDCTKY
ncbi:hypothetical protein MTR67_033805 [Solanum verrucosum]|uniref:Peptidase A1 domain-containing protein n=1 Tax=Solanum verrucosum TaxID=315347 RepID=A0AAF0U6N9_SOLVR|nr:hypothetical protein MTR67_033805 [Solanum verrucosum]